MGEFEDFLKQERADAEERLNLRRADPRTPFDRTMAFVEAVQTDIKGREAEISTMKGDLRLFAWERQPARIWLRASDSDPYDVPGIGATLLGSRLASSLPHATSRQQVIDVSKLGLTAIEQRAGRLLIDFFKAAYT